MSDFEKNLSDLLRARFPYLYISTWEENRLIMNLSEICENEEIIHTPRKLFTWKSTEGMREYNKSVKSNTKNPMAALDFIQNYNEPALFLLLDFHAYFGLGHQNPDPQIVRKLRDLIPYLKQSPQPKNVIFISPSLLLPDDLQKDVTIVDFDLPTVEEIRTALEEMIQVNKGGNVEINMSPEDEEKLSKAAVGLTLQEAENAFARAMVDDGKLDINDLNIILQEKSQVIKKSEILEFIDSKVNIEDVGGLENLKKWLIKRDKSWLDSAKKYGLPSPKGVLLTGVPGCGKSLIAKTISTKWQLPLLRLDVSRIFSGLVGSSEENMRRAIKTAEAISPCILWIDEIEKGFSGVGSTGDSGTSSRIFGTFLSWMQEKTKPVFVVATANNIKGIPSEMVRKGRFDEIFFIDLPTHKERKQIFKVHIESRLTDSAVKGDFKVNEDTLKHLASLTEGFGGSEIEQIVIIGLYDAFAEDRSIKMEDLENAIKNTVPLSVTQSEQIVAIRQWANLRAVSATAQSDREEYENNILKDSNDDKSPEDDSQPKDDIIKNRGGRTLDF